MFRILITTVMIIISWSAALTVYIVAFMVVGLLLKHTPDCLPITKYIVYLGTGALCMAPCTDCLKAGHKFAKDMFKKEGGVQ